MNVNVNENFRNFFILLQNVVKETVNIYIDIHWTLPESVYETLLFPTTFNCCKTVFSALLSHLTS